MRKPEEIQKEIDKLNEELRKSKLENALTPLWTKKQNDEGWEDPGRIGFFRLDKAKTILTALNEGKKLLIKHEAIGNFIVQMNGNGNVICVYNEDGSELERGCYNGFKNSSSVLCYKPLINDNSIMSFIVWHAGDWYLINEEYYG